MMPPMRRPAVLALPLALMLMSPLTAHAAPQAGVDSGPAPIAARPSPTLRASAKAAKAVKPSQRTLPPVSAEKLAQWHIVHDAQGNVRAHTTDPHPKYSQIGHLTMMGNLLTQRYRLDLTGFEIPSFFWSPEARGSFQVKAAPDRIATRLESVWPSLGKEVAMTGDLQSHADQGLSDATAGLRVDSAIYKPQLEVEGAHLDLAVAGDTHTAGYRAHFDMTAPFVSSAQAFRHATVQVQHVAAGLSLHLGMEADANAPLGRRVRNLTRDPQAASVRLTRRLARHHVTVVSLTVTDPHASQGTPGGSEAAPVPQKAPQGAKAPGTESGVASMVVDVTVSHLVDGARTDLIRGLGIDAADAPAFNDALTRMAATRVKRFEVSASVDGHRVGVDTEVSLENTDQLMLGAVDLIRVLFAHPPRSFIEGMSGFKLPQTFFSQMVKNLDEMRPALDDMRAVASSSRGSMSLSFTNTEKEGLHASFALSSHADLREVLPIFRRHGLVTIELRDSKAHVTVAPDRTQIDLDFDWRGPWLAALRRMVRLLAYPAGMSDASSQTSQMSKTPPTDAPADATKPIPVIEGLCKVDVAGFTFDATWNRCRLGLKAELDASGLRELALLVEPTFRPWLEGLNGFEVRSIDAGQVTTVTSDIYYGPLSAEALAAFPRKLMTWFGPGRVASTRQTRTPAEACAPDIAPVVLPPAAR